MAWNKLRRTIFDADHPFYEKTFEEQMADLQANLDEVKLHEKQARALLAKARKVPAAATSSRPADPVAG